MNRRILLAGTNSGCGKTTVTLALLAALKQKGVALTSFKCGPDYIDPMFHRRLLQVPCYNLDSFLMHPEHIYNVLQKQARSFAVIEGVMGYYDGIGLEGKCSTYDIAKTTSTPTILVINAKGMYTSVGAILRGFCQYKPDNQIVGVIFNNVSASTYPALAQIAKAEGLTPCGYLPRVDSAALESRRLGLITEQEIENLGEKLDALAQTATATLDLDAITHLATSIELCSTSADEVLTLSAVKIAVAKDKAFCFIYEENLNLLRQLGAEICYFSPLVDQTLPPNIDALYLPGGYPELYLQQLSQNQNLLQEILTALRGGLPAWAECGGFMYLHKHIDGTPMVGYIEGEVKQTDKLQNFGYATLQSQTDNLLCAKGDTLPIHEFHYYQSDTPGKDCLAVKNSGKSYTCVHATPTFWGGFPHLYLASNPAMAKRLVQVALAYQKRRHA